MPKLSEAFLRKPSFPEPLKPNQTAREARRGYEPKDLYEPADLYKGCVDVDMELEMNNLPASSKTMDLVKTDKHPQHATKHQAGTTIDEMYTVELNTDPNPKPDPPPRLPRAELPQPDYRATYHGLDEKLLAYVSGQVLVSGLRGSSPNNSDTCSGTDSDGSNGSDKGVWYGNHLALKRGPDEPYKDWIARQHREFHRRYENQVVECEYTDLEAKWDEHNPPGPTAPMNMRICYLNWLRQSYHP